MSSRLRSTILALSIALSLAQPALAQGSRPPDLSPKELASAVEISNINARTVPVGQGERVVYHIAGSDTYVVVSADPASPVRGPYAGLGLHSLASTFTQTCGINIYKGPLLAAILRNRANVTYYTGATRAPARFNWMDMKGPISSPIFYPWQDPGPRSTPSLGSRFESSGYVQAWGNLKKCVAGLCTTQYFVSYLRVSSTRTYCQ